MGILDIQTMTEIAEELREYMAKLGVRTVDELVGRTELLKRKDDIQFSGMALATIFGIVLNLTLPKEFAKNKDKK